MYSFAQRPDVCVIDEPLYGHYLRVTGAGHPGRDEILETTNCDGNAVMCELLARQVNNATPRLFLKHMAHHLVDLDLGFLQETCNIFLLRNPREMLPSLTVQLPDAELVDTGLKRQWQLFNDLRGAGQHPVILDSRELLLDPRGVLRQLCQHLTHDGNAVMCELLARQVNNATPRLFLKHMAHHLVDLDLGFLQETCNIFLLRNPREMLPSLTVQLPDAELVDTGLKRQWQLFNDLRGAGQHPVILDSRELLLDPRGVLRQLCQHLDLEFDARMLLWEAAPRPEDGIWARHWYHAVHKSTGFAPYERKNEFPDHLQDLLLDCEPWYDKLFEYALRADSTGEEE